MKGKRNVINRVTNPQERQARTDQPRNTASQILERKQIHLIHHSLQNFIIAKANGLLALANPF